MRTILNGIIRLLVEICELTGRVHYITGEATGKEDVYLVRYIVFKSKFGGFYIHRFMRSDSSDPHDHPWNFITYIVSGGYTEHFYNREKAEINSQDNGKFSSLWTLTYNIRKAGSFAFRRATDIHRVVIDCKYSIKEIDQAPLTAVLMFKRQRTWGFWPLKHKGSIYIDWRRYLNIRPGDPRLEGSE